MRNYREFVEGNRSQEAAKYFELPKRVILLALNFEVLQL